VLYVASKTKGSEIWGTLQLRPRHNSEPYINNIQDRGDIVKHFSQENQINKEMNMADFITRTEHREDGVYKVLQSTNGDILDEYCVSDRKSPALADENIINKENFMEMKFDEIGNIIPDQEEQTRDPKEEAFYAAVHQRKIITEAMKAGNLCCLPGADGYADTAPAVNLVNGTIYHGANLLFLKEHARENGFPTAEYLTTDQIQKAREQNPEIAIRQGQKGVSIYVSEKNEETGGWDTKSFRLFNVAQTTKPAVLKTYAEQVQQEKLQEKEAYLQTQYGTGFKLEPKQKEAGNEITCTSTEPVKYFGQYLAAVSMGGKFKASPEQASEFAQNMETVLYAKMDNGHTNPFILSKISNEASQFCKEIIKEARIEARKAELPDQKLDQSQSRGRGL